MASSLSRISDLIPFVKSYKAYNLIRGILKLLDYREKSLTWYSVQYESKEITLELNWLKGKWYAYGYRLKKYDMGRGVSMKRHTHASGKFSETSVKDMLKHANCCTCCDHD